MYRKLIFLLIIFLLGGLAGYFAKDSLVSVKKPSSSNWFKIQAAIDFSSPSISRDICCRTYSSSDSVSDPRTESEKYSSWLPSPCGEKSLRGDKNTTASSVELSFGREQTGHTWFWANRRWQFGQYHLSSITSAGLSFNARSIST